MKERRALVLGSAAAAAALVAGCAEVASGPAAVVSLSFDTSTVAVVLNDTLRDTLGLPLRLRATAFNATDDTVAPTAAAITFVVGDRPDSAGVRIAGDLVIGTRLRTAAGRVFAQSGGLQSLPKTVDVIRRPGRLVDTTARDTARYVLGFGQSPGRPQVRIVADSAGQRLGVPRVVVRFAVERAAPTVADSVLLVDERSIGVSSETARVTFIPRSPLDTTDASGYAGRRVLVFVRPGVATARDSVVLRAVVAYPAVYRVAALAADTVRIVTPVIPQTATTP